MFQPVHVLPNSLDVLGIGKDASQLPDLETGTAQGEQKRRATQQRLTTAKAAAATRPRRPVEALLQLRV